jgi:hypothetical protein
MVRHLDACRHCDSFAHHLSEATAIPDPGLMDAFGCLADDAPRYCKRETYSVINRRLHNVLDERDDLAKERNDLADECDALRDELKAAHAELSRLSAFAPVPSCDTDAARQLEQARVASLGGVLDVDPPSSTAGPSNSRGLSLRGRVQVPPALSQRIQDAPSAPLSQRLQDEPAAFSSRKGKERAPPAPYEDTSPILPYTNVESIEVSPPAPIVERPRTLEDLPESAILFPPLTGKERPHKVRVLGDGTDQRGNRTLFIRTYGELYAYQGAARENALQELSQGNLTRRSKWYPEVPIRFEKEQMGPIRLFNSRDAVRNLFEGALQDTEDEPRRTRQALNLVTYLNIWKRHRDLETSELVHVALNVWKPPAWHAERTKQRKQSRKDGMAQRRAEQGQVIEGPKRQTAVRTQEPEETQPSGISTEEPRVDSDQFESMNEVVPQEAPPPLPPAPPARSQPARLNFSKRNPPLPRDAPALDATTTKWADFIEQCQGQCSLEKDRAGLRRMFPGAVGQNVRMDDSDSPLKRPTRQYVRGFLLLERLAPVPRSDFNRMVWQRELVRLLLVPGRYNFLLRWAEVLPRVGHTAPWSGTFTKDATLAEVAVYLAANGVTAQIADDVVPWARRLAREMLDRVDMAGGFDSQATASIYAPIQEDLRFPIRDDRSLNRSLEWYDVESARYGAQPDDLAPIALDPQFREDTQVFERVGETIPRYDLPHAPIEGGHPSEEGDVSMGEEADHPDATGRM